MHIRREGKNEISQQINIKKQVYNAYSRDNTHKSEWRVADKSYSNQLDEKTRYNI